VIPKQQIGAACTGQSGMISTRPTAADSSPPPRVFTASGAKDEQGVLLYVGETGQKGGREARLDDLARGRNRHPPRGC
jgi:hypothetical protein